MSLTSHGTALAVAHVHARVGAMLVSMRAGRVRLSTKQRLRDAAAKLHVFVLASMSCQTPCCSIDADCQYVNICLLCWPRPLPHSGLPKQPRQPLLPLLDAACVETPPVALPDDETGA